MVLSKTPLLSCGLRSKRFNRNRHSDDHIKWKYVDVAQSS